MTIRAPKHSTLLTFSNPKIMKGLKQARGTRTFLPFVVMMTPGMRSGASLCPYDSPGCLAACLNVSGQVTMNWSTSVSIHEARYRRSRLFLEDKNAFFNQLSNQIEKAIQFASVHTYVGIIGKKPAFEPSRKGMIPVCRLNGTSDISYEKINIPGTKKTIFERFPHVQFYDYTKWPNRFDLPKNYHLTYSYHETYKRSGTKFDARIIGSRYLERGVNMAVVFRIPKREVLPHRFIGYPVIDGSLHDLRFLDPAPSIVGLYALGNAKQDRSGFTIDTKGLLNPSFTYGMDGDLDQQATLFPDLDGE